MRLWTTDEAEEGAGEAGSREVRVIGSSGVAAAWGINHYLKYWQERKLSFFRMKNIINIYIYCRTKSHVAWDTVRIGERTKKNPRHRGDSNPRSPVYKTGALTPKLRRRSHTWLHFRPPGPAAGGEFHFASPRPLPLPRQRLHLRILLRVLGMGKVAEVNVAFCI